MVIDDRVLADLEVFDGGAPNEERCAVRHRVRVDQGTPRVDQDVLPNADVVYANAIAEGYVPYVSRRALSQLTTTPPPDY